MTRIALLLAGIAPLAFAAPAAAQTAAPKVQAAFAAAGFTSQSWVTPLNSPGAHLL